jgi:sarcosine oxidase subunit beta
MDADNVALVGGGIIGCSIAYYLAREGVSATIFEERELASGASGANQGVIAAQLYDPPLLDLILESRKLYTELEKYLPIDFEFDKCGSIVCATEKRHWAILEERVKTLQEFGVKVELIEGTRLREMEPSLSTDIIGASMCSEDFLVNPIKLTYALAYAARSLGSKIYTYTHVRKIIMKNKMIESILTDRGAIKTRYVVISAGAWTPLIEGLEEFKLPIQPQRGQLFVTETTPPCNFKLILDADYLTTAFNSKLAGTSRDLRIRRGIASVLNQTKSGNWLIGSSRDFAGFDKRTVMQDLKIIAARAMKFLPHLRYVNTLRTFASLRPYSADELPILGKVPGVEGLFVATGHCGNGVALAPITGKIIADLITEGKTQIKIDEFSISRFNAIKS